MIARATALADYHVFYGDANLINTELERYLKVTREDVQRVANAVSHRQRQEHAALPRAGACGSREVGVAR